MSVRLSFTWDPGVSSSCNKTFDKGSKSTEPLCKSAAPHVQYCLIHLNLLVTYFSVHCWGHFILKNMFYEDFKLWYTLSQLNTVVKVKVQWSKQYIRVEHVTSGAKEESIHTHPKLWYSRSTIIPELSLEKALSTSLRLVNISKSITVRNLLFQSTPLIQMTVKHNSYTIHKWKSQYGWDTEKNWEKKGMCISK